MLKIIVTLCCIILTRFSINTLIKIIGMDSEDAQVIRSLHTLLCILMIILLCFSFCGITSNILY